MQHRGVLVISSALALTPALAWAQGPPPPPPPPPVSDPVLAGTGTRAVDRGLILPAGKAEVEAGFYLFSAGRFDLFDIVDLTLAGRYSFGTAEVFAGVELVALQPGEDDNDTPTDFDALQVLHAGARIAAGPGDVRLRAARIGNDSNLTWLELDGAFEMKRKVNDQLAVIGEGGGVFHLLMIDFGEGDDESAHALYLYGRGAGQFQATPEIAIEGGLQLAVPTVSGDSSGRDSDDPWNTVLTLFAEGSYAMGKIDVFGRGEIHRDRTLFPSQVGPADLEGGGASFTSVMIGIRARP